MVVHRPTAPGAGMVHLFAGLVERLPRNLLVVASRKRCILLESKCPLFDARRVFTPGQYLALGLKY